MVHGLLDHVMTMLGVPFDAEKGYSIKEASDGAFFDGRCANILYTFPPTPPPPTTQPPTGVRTR